MVTYGFKKYESYDIYRVAAAIARNAAICELRNKGKLDEGVIKLLNQNIAKLTLLTDLNSDEKANIDLLIYTLGLILKLDEAIKEDNKKAKAFTPLPHLHAMLE